MGWIANILIISGAWQIGHKRRYGFALAMSGSAIWATIGGALGRPDMVFIECVMICIAARNYLLWGRK